jgi:hypothetical protein
MQLDLLYRVGRSGQYELAFEFTIIDSMTHVIPDLRLLLPLVKQPGSGTLQQQAEIKLAGWDDGWINVYPDLAFCQTTGALGLATGLRPAD